MLNLRLYRTAWLPVLFCAVIVAFSLHERPRGVPTTLAPDAFDGPRAARTLEGLATAFPDRRPGSPGDDRLAERVRAGFVHAFCAGVDRAECSDRVRERRFSARTIDGHRELRTVVAQRPGRLEGRIVVLAHRDAAGRGAKADLSATAGLLELAQVLAGRVTERTVTLVSTSGGSGGSAGAADFAAHAGGPVDAVIVLGDLAGTVSHSPWVVPWSNARGSASMRLQRTAELAVREEAGSPGSPGVATQFLRLAYPLTVSEQGPLDAAGIPAVLIGPGGELGATPDEAVDANRLRIFGRGVLRTITALDNAPDVERAPATGLVVHGQVMPEWAMRLLVAALLLPALLGAVDGLARVRRRRARTGRWVLWTLAAALPFVAAALFAIALRAVDLLGAAPAAPVGPGRVPIGGVALVATLLVLAGSWIFVRRAAVESLRAGRPDTAAAAAGVATLTALVVTVVWVRNPYSAALLVPAAHLWLFAVAPDVPIGRGRAIALAAGGFAPLALAALGYGLALGAGPLALAWIALLAVAGGHAGPLGVVLGAVVLGCGVSALLVARCRVAPPGRIAPPDVVSRGPLTYAGPGSLGGTESALRR
ncbi:MAG: M28 family peptidase [Actinobacteria bacterium]|nr:MAG: M28 family peptidase [Actinomycetota bacterium]